MLQRPTRCWHIQVVKKTVPTSDSYANGSNPICFSVVLKQNHCKINKMYCAFYGTAYTYTLKTKPTVK